MADQVEAPEVSGAGSPRGDKERRRYHEHLLGAFATGATVGEAATLAGVSRRTAQRWKQEHWPKVLEARREALDGLLGRVRSALPVALERLTAIARDSADEGVAVRASVALWDIFTRVTESVELEERLATLEHAASNRRTDEAPHDDEERN